MKHDEFTCINVTLFSHQLNESHKSFNSDLKTSDFKKSLYWTIEKAKKVTYVNPKGESYVIKQV